MPTPSGALDAAAIKLHRQGGGPLAEMDLTSLAPRIKAPTLIVIGEQDFPAFHKSAKWLEQNIAGSRKVVLAPARHASILERQEEFSEAARAFLRG
jgi:pimeloyl-ACP methyl ester carboxylesterase